jgi:hypothetical protein
MTQISENTTIGLFKVKSKNAFFEKQGVFVLALITHFLKNSLPFTLYPKKIFLSHFSKSVNFLGTIIKPNRIYIANRTKRNFYAACNSIYKIIIVQLENLKTARKLN